MDRTGRTGGGKDGTSPLSPGTVKSPPGGPSGDGEAVHTIEVAVTTTRPPDDTTARSGRRFSLKPGGLEDVLPGETQPRSGADQDT